MVVSVTNKFVFCYNKHKRSGIMSPVEKAYQKFKQRNDKIKIINGKIYYRIVLSEFFNPTGFEDGHLLVVPSPDMPQKKNAIYEDENGNHFTLGGRNHIRFIGEIPKWYFECGKLNMEWKETKEIGKYLTIIE